MKTRLLMVLLVILVTLPAQDSFACECVPNVSYTEIVDNADLVFIGTVSSIVDGENSEHREQLITLDVHSIPKGVLTDSQVTTTSDWNSCSVDYKIGTTYSVVIFDVKTMSTGICSTVPLKYIDNFSNIPNSVILAMNEPEVPSIDYDKATLIEKITDEQIDEMIIMPGHQVSNFHDDEESDKSVKVKTVGDDAPFFGIFVYLDNLISWILGK